MQRELRDLLKSQLPPSPGPPPPPPPHIKQPDVQEEHPPPFTETELGIFWKSYVYDPSRMTAYDARRMGARRGQIAKIVYADDSRPRKENWPTRSKTKGTSYRISFKNNKWRFAEWSPDGKPPPLAAQLEHEL